jgi:glyoxylase-like metal-dependent hydrolase (beta-lactamase superfamily II)
MTDTAVPDTTDEASSWEVIAVRYGTLETQKSALFYRYGAHGEPDVPQTMDYFFWLIRGGGQTIVVDTGFDPTCGERRGRSCLITPEAALERLGVDPSAVDQLILTHFHYDHIGNVHLFPNAELIVSAEEFEFYTSPMAQRFQLKEAVEGPEVDFIVEANRKGNVRLVTGEVTIAPGISALVVGGHAPGQMIVTIDTGRREVVLASDAVHLYEELEKDRPFSVLVDLPGMYRAFDLLRDRERSGAVVVPGHDPDVASRFPAVEGVEPDLAYQLS